MSRESGPGIEVIMVTREKVIDFILKNVPQYSKAELDRTVGDGQTTLNYFLNEAKNGSEWTDPHGFKINVLNDEFKITIN